MYNKKICFAVTSLIHVFFSMALQRNNQFHYKCLEYKKLYTIPFPLIMEYLKQGPSALTNIFKC